MRRQAHAGVRRGTSTVADLLSQRTERTRARAAAAGIRADSPHWRPDRLVLRQHAVEDSRPDRPDDGRRRHAARPARSRDSLSGKHAGFLARGAYEPAGGFDYSAEMKVPGRAWLEFRAEPDGAFTVIRQLAQFEPRGLIGILYWYLLSPIHEVMFRGMLRRIAAAAAVQENRKARAALTSPAARPSARFRPTDSASGGSR